MKFTTPLLALAVSASAAFAPTAFAQSADLSMTGRILPGACVVELGGGGIADLGNIRADTLNADAATVLDPVALPLAVTCDGEVRFAFQGSDNASESATRADRYGLGFTAHDEKIGGANLLVADVIADGVPGFGTHSVDNGATWGNSTPGGNYSLGMHELLGFAKADTVDTGPAAIETLQGTLNVWAHIQPGAELTLTDEVQINGNATLNIVYL